MKLRALLAPSTFGFDVLSFQHKFPGTFSSKYTDFLLNSCVHFCVSKSCFRLGLLQDQDPILAFSMRPRWTEQDTKHSFSVEDLPSNVKGTV